MYAIKQNILCVLNAATQEQIIVYAGNAHVVAIYRSLVVAVCLFTPDHFMDCSSLRAVNELRSATKNTKLYKLYNNPTTQLFRACGTLTDSSAHSRIAFYENSTKVDRLIWHWISLHFGHTGKVVCRWGSLCVPYWQDGLQLTGISLHRYTLKHLHVKIKAIYYMYVQNFSCWQRLMPTPVDARSKAWVCGRSLAGIVGSKQPGHACLSLVSVVCCQVEVCSVVCCQVEVSARNWSLAQRSPTDCVASLYVI